MGDEQLRIARGQKKAAVTRQLGTLERHIAENKSPDVVEAGLVLAAQAFDELGTAHDALAASFATETDISAGEVWFTKAHQEYVTKVKIARQWIDLKSGATGASGPSGNVTSTSTGNTGGDTNNAPLSQSNVMNLLTVPKIGIDKFDGNPIEYQNFMSIFDEMVGTVDDQVKLTRLLYYTTGPAKLAIKNCALVGGSAGYKEAREILSSRFGDSQLIAESLVNELKCGKPLRKPRDLQQMADELKMALRSLDDLGNMSEIDNQKSVKEILQRCPQYIRNQWSKKAVRVKRANGSYPAFKDFVAFFREKAADCNDPVYGSDMFEPQMHPKGSSSQFVVSGETPRATDAMAPPGATAVPLRSLQRSQPGKCVLCNDNHSIFQCDVFKAKSPAARAQVAREKRLCFNCLAPGHLVRDCKRSTVCQVQGCGKRHAKLLHFDRQTAENPRDSSNEAAVSNQTISNGSISANSNNVYRPMVAVMVNGVRTLAFLDNGSTNSFVSKSLAARLGLSGPMQNFVMTTVTETSNVRSNLIKCRVESMDGTFSEELNNVCVVDQVKIRYPETEIDLSMYPHLTDIPFTDVKRGDVADLLIGMDNSHILLQLDVRYDPENIKAPYATRCVLGWTLNGPVITGNEVRSDVGVVSCCRVSLEQQVHKLWDIENNDLNNVSYSVEDSKVIELWQSEIEHVDGHYSLPIPWRECRPSLPNNRYLAVCRLESQVKRLNKSGLTQSYDEGIRAMLDKGYAERVPDSELSVSDGCVWYLPHHHVMSAAKPGKIRIVFDCAAQYRGISLNNQCFQGPDLTNKLINVLLKFRQYRFGIMADIEGMYLQVRIPDKDRNALRFLWFDQGRLVEYRMTSHLFGGIWCSASSTFALRKTVSDFTDDDLVKKTVLESFYVDDMLKSVHSSDEAMRVVHGVKRAISYGGFNLTKFVINNADLLEHIGVNDRATEVKDMVPDSESRALGVQWQVNEDTFHYVIKPTETDVTTTVTRRIILSKVSSMYDPLGQISPIVLLGKMIFQECTKLGLDWDDPVPSNLERKWQLWRSTLRELESLHFPRCIIPSGFEFGVAELHHFSDASAVGYGACSYLRIIRPDGKIHVTLIASKGRLAPIRAITIPRLELAAAVIAVKLDDVIRSTLDIQCIPSTFWTDSQIVLAYIKSEDKRFKVFVANRVAVIRESSSPAQWRHIPGETNPADILSRGCNVAEISELWHKGPEFLSLFKCDWPTEDKMVTSLNDDIEVCVSHTNATNDHSVMCSGPVIGDAPHAHPVDVLLNHFSSYYKVKKALCWLRRFVTFMKQKQCSQGHITVTELNDAERVIIKHVQRTSFNKEIAEIERSGHVHRSSNLLKLCPRLDNGLLVIGGRLEHASVPDHMKRPVILPRQHRLSELICREVHGNAHLGSEWVLSQVRQRYWIIRARSLIKKIRRDCVVCRRLYAAPCYQQMANLPPERCNLSEHPFTNTGVDLCGPFYVTQGRSSVKRYACVYTCFSVRAVHIEMLSNLDTDAFINGLLRFVSRRGFPAKVWSDNGTNFVGAEAELRRSFKQLDRTKVVTVARKRNIEWNFNPPHASHFGGVWERVIRTLRQVLVAILSPNTRLTDDVLQTVFCQVENIINSRPITKCSDDAHDENPLTPNHLLMMQSNAAYPWGVVQKSDTYRRRWRHVQHIVDHFWKRWLKEYIPELQRRQKWLRPVRNVTEGDLVLVVDEASPRGSWPLGLVEETKTGRDGLVRSAKIRCRTGQYVRPITKLVLLEGVHYSD